MNGQTLNNIVLFVTSGIGLGVIGLGVYFLHEPLPTLDFKCHFKEPVTPEVKSRSDVYMLPKRNPFFYPAPEVSVSLKVASEQGNSQTKSLSGNVPTNMVYKGMMIWGEDKIAIIFSPVDKKTRFVKLGEFVRGYKVLDITEDMVVLSKEGGLSITTLKLGGVSEK